MTKCTSAEAAKILRRLRLEKDAIESKEMRQTTYVSTADPSDMALARPDYDYAKTQKTLQEYDHRILTIRHALNLFNLTTEVPGTGMTIDQVLIYLPQLSERVRKLQNLGRELPRERLSGRDCTFGSQHLVEYRFTNYDPEEALADGKAAEEELARIQTALDLVNSTMELEIRREREVRCFVTRYSVRYPLSVTHASDE